MDSELQAGDKPEREQPNFYRRARGPSEGAKGGCGGKNTVGGHTTVQGQTVPSRIALPGAIAEQWYLIQVNLEETNPMRARQVVGTTP